MTIKMIFARSSQKGGRQGVRKEGQQGTQLEILLSAFKSTEKNSINRKVAFYCRRFFPGNAVTIILDNFPPSTPKNLLRLFFRNCLTRLNLTSGAKNNLKRLFLTLF